MSKYKAKKTVVDGITFDSKREADRYLELKLLERAGLIKDLELQVRFILIPGFKYHGKTIRALTYACDFRYLDTETNKTIIEDVKGMQTQVFIIKWKLMQHMLKDNDNIELRIVK